MISAPFVHPTRWVQIAAKPRTAAYCVKPSMGNEKCSTKMWVSLSGLTSVFWHTDQRICQHGFDNLNLVFFSFPLGVTTDELSHTDLPSKPSCCNTDGSFMVGSQSLHAGDFCLQALKDWVRMPLKGWQLSCRRGNQTLLGLINMPRSKEWVGVEVGKWTQGFWHAVVCASS